MWDILHAFSLAVILFVALIVFPVLAGLDIFYNTGSLDDLTWIQVLISWAIGMALNFFVITILMALYFFVITILVVLAFVSESKTSTKNREPSLVKMKWKSFKEKMCFKVDFK